MNIKKLNLLKFKRFYSLNDDLKELTYNRTNKDFFNSMAAKYMDNSEFWSKSANIMKIYIEPPQNIINTDIIVAQIINGQMDITNKLVTKDVCLKLVESIMFKFEKLEQNIPDEYKDDEYYKHVAKYQSLKYIPADKLTKEICDIGAATQYYQANFEYVPEKYKDQQFYEKMFEHTIHCINLIPEHMITMEMCYHVLSGRPEYIKYIPNKLKTLDVCVYATNKVYQNHYHVEEILKHVPDNIKSNMDFWVLTINNGSCMFKFLPKQFYDDSRFHTQIKMIKYRNCELQYIPIQLKTKQFYLNCIDWMWPNEFEGTELYKDLFVDKIKHIDNDIIDALLGKSYELIKYLEEYNVDRKIIEKIIDKGRMLQYIPYNYLDYDLCEKAVLLFPQDVKHVPMNIIDDNLMILAVSKRDMLGEIRFSDRTYEICKAAIQNFPEALEHVPVEHYEQICDEITDWKKFPIRFIPKKYRTIDVCYDSVNKYGNNIRFVPCVIISEKLIKVAIDTGHLINLKYIPSQFKNKKFYEYCINKNVLYVAQIDEQYVTQQMWIAAVKKDVYLIKKIPEKYITDELCMEIIGGNTWCNDEGQMLELIPDKFKTFELCKMANKKGVKAVAHTPDRFMNDEMKNIIYETKLDWENNVYKYSVY